MKKKLIMMNVLIASIASTVALASCSKGTNLKSYKNEVEKDKFWEKFEKAYGSFDDELLELTEDIEEKSYTSSSDYVSTNSSISTINKVKEKETIKEEESINSKYDCKNRAYTYKEKEKSSSKNLVNESSSKSTDDHTIFATKSRFYQLDNINKSYRFTDMKDGSDLVSTYAVMKIENVSNNFIISDRTENWFDQDDKKYYVDNTVFTIACETKFKTKEEYTGTAKQEVQFIFDGGEYTYIEKLTYDYTYEDKSMKETTIAKGTSSKSMNYKIDKSSISYSSTSSSNDETTKTKEEYSGTIKSNNKSNYSISFKFGDVSIDTSLDGYYEE